MKTTKTLYEEGRAAAMGRLQRLLCECGEVSPEVTNFVLRDEAAYWRRLLLHHTDADIPSLPSLAYSRGGLDVVESAWLAHLAGQATDASLAA
ncbi:MAG: hypothetical protein U0X20_21180 [Caldilineaceae bacterium]